MDDRWPRLIALYGASGAGKSTTGQLINKHCESLGLTAFRLCVADPLYRVQAFIYEQSGRPLADPKQQDAELLALLGRHMRTINPNCLIDNFTERLRALIKSLDLSERRRTIVLCEDMRAHDWPALSEFGFLPVLVSADVEACLRRRHERGDITIPSNTLWTEQGTETVAPAFTIHNNGTLEELGRQVECLLTGLVD